MKIEFYRHNIEEEDIEQVREVLRSIILTTGKVTSTFEARFSQYTGCPHVVGLTSCTAALHLSLLAMGVGPGDEVITTPMTFLATATAILHTGAKPVFVDVHDATGLIEPNLIENAITPQTRAIVVVHLYGTMADMKAIAEIAKHHRLKVVEDCAHCIEGERDGIRPGAVSEAACYSFFATKSLCSGEGGAVATRDKTLADKIRLLRLHGMTRDAQSRHETRYEHWEMELAGWKYNMDDIHAALLLNQVKRLDRYWKRRNEICEMYEEAFTGTSHIRFPKVIGKGARHLQTVWVRSNIRDRVVHGLQDRGVGVTVNYRALHTLRYFRAWGKFEPTDFPEAHRIGCETLSLPLYAKMSNEEVHYVIDSLKTVVSTLTGDKVCEEIHHLEQRDHVGAKLP